MVKKYNISDKRIESVSTKIQKIVSTARLKICKLQQEIIFLEGEIKEAQSMCLHLETIYHERPCAEADSWNECICCGASV